MLYYGTRDSASTSRHALFLRTSECTNEAQLNIHETSHRARSQNWKVTLTHVESPLQKEHGDMRPRLTNAYT